MFPIHDHRGHVIGFGGRVIDAGEPKYLNSPETPVFSKGRELYGLFHARSAIRDAGKVVVVEGYMDVVALAQHGIGYAVATLGTATTPTHVQKLFRQTDTVVYCFDGDAAGRRAAWRALENTLAALADGKNAKFLFLPDGDDPDDYVRKRGRAAFEDALAAATPLSEFLFDELAARNPPVSAEGQAALAQAAKGYLADVRAPILHAVLRRRLAELTGLAEAELRTLLGAAGEPNATPAPVEPEAPPPRRASPSGGSRRPSPSLARRLLEALLMQPSLASAVDFNDADETTVEGKALAAVMDALRQQPMSTPAIVQRFAGTPHESVVVAALEAAEDGLTVEDAEAILRDGSARLGAQREAREIGRILEIPLASMSESDKAALRRWRTTAKPPTTG
jgi:DNA primase